MATRHLCHRHEQQGTGTDVPASSHIDGTEALAEGLYIFLKEVQGYRATCLKHEGTAAIHDAGKELQVYRMFKRDDAVARQLFRASEALPSWGESLYWSSDGDRWEKLQRDIMARMKKHKKQHPIITRGVSWEGLPVLIHAYKYEPDPFMKVELVMPAVTSVLPPLPLKTIADALRCHEFLIPDYMTVALPPYQGHATDFLTIREYLSSAMSPNLYNLYCGFPERKNGSIP